MQIDEEIQEDDFEQLLADKQHKELMKAIRELVKSIKKDEDEDGKISGAIIKQSQDLGLLLVRIETALNKPVKEFPTPQVTVNNDTKDLTKELNLLRLLMENMLVNQDELIRLTSIKPTKLIPKKTYGNLESISVEYTDVRKLIKQ